MTCVRGVLLHGSETWPMTTGDLLHIKTSDHAMIHWIYDGKTKWPHSSGQLWKRLDLQHIEDLLTWNSIWLSGPLHQQEETSWIKKIMNFVVYGPTSQSRPKLRWKDVANKDLHKKCLSLSLISHGLKWRNVIRPVTQQIGLQPILIGIWRWSDQ